MEATPGTLNPLTGNLKELVPFGGFILTERDYD
jgi:hypothetical protein